MPSLLVPGPILLPPSPLTLRPQMQHGFSSTQLAFPASTRRATPSLHHDLLHQSRCLLGEATAPSSLFWIRVLTGVWPQFGYDQGYITSCSTVLLLFNP